MARWIAAVALLFLILLALLAGMAGGYNARLIDLLRVWVDTLAGVLYWAIIAAVLLAIVFAALTWLYRRRRTRTRAGTMTAAAVVAPRAPPPSVSAQGIPAPQPAVVTGPPDHIPRATFDHVPAWDVDKPDDHTSNVSSARRSDDVPS